MIRIAICDDEIGTCSEIENMIPDFADSRACRIETEVFYSGETLYDAISEECLFDLIFLDLQLFALDGVSPGRQTREQLKIILLLIAVRMCLYMHSLRILCWIVGIGDLENIHYSRVSSTPMNL